MRAAVAVVLCLGLALGAALVNPLQGDAARPVAGSRDWAEVRAILSGIQGQATAPIGNVTTPKFTPAMLVGNGDVGVAVGGETASNQRFFFGKGDFWGSAWNAGHAQLVTAILSLGNLNISSPQGGSGTGYQMTQDILDAEVRSTVNLGGAAVSMRSWTSDAGNVFYTELSSPAGAPSVPIQVDLALPGPDAHTTYPTTAGSKAGTIWVSRHNNLTGPADFQSEVGIAVRPVGMGFSQTSSTATTATGSFTLKGGSTVELASVFRSDARTGSGGPAQSCLATQAAAVARGLTPGAVRADLAAHREWWKRFWLRSFVQVNDPTLMAYWYGALYAMGSASRPRHVAPDMNGPWVTAGDFTQFPRYWINYNFEAPFYGMGSANHADLIQPYSDAIVAQAPLAQNLTAGGGYPGFTFMRTFGPFAQFQPTPAPTPVAPTRNPAFLDQKSNGGFALMPMIDYYEYTRDARFLQTKLYPLLKQADVFWRSYLTQQGNELVVLLSSAHEASVDTNPNLDLGFIRRIAATLIQTSALLGVDADLRPVWQDVLDRLAPYPTATVGGQTVFTIAQDVKGSTSTSVTFEPGNQPINMEGVVFPGQQLSVGGDPSLLQVARNSLQQMNSWGVTPGGNSNNGFPKEFPIAARVGWPAADLESKLDAAIRFHWRATNLTVAQGGGGIETSGTIEAVDSMLMQSENGIVRLFGDADWPTAQDAHFKRLLAKGGFEVSSSITGGTVGAVDVTSTVGGTFTLQNPWGAPASVVALDRNGNPTGTVPSDQSNGTVAFKTRAGRSYRVSASSSSPRS